jgi:hypothetical protein
VFFPATLQGKLDENALHAAEPALDEKWVSQVGLMFRWSYGPQVRY